MHAATFRLLADSSPTPAIFPWPPPRGEALAAYPPITPTRGDQKVWADGAYITDLPRQILAATAKGPDIAFVRSNGNTRVPGLPWLPGMAGNPTTGPTLCMDEDIFKYGPDNTDAQRLFFTQKQRTGCTHIVFAIGQAVADGWTQTQFIALCRTWQQHYGGYAVINVFGWGPEGNPWYVRDALWEQNAPLVTPWILALRDAGVLHPDRAMVCLAWQANQFWSGTAMVSNALGLGALVRPLVDWYTCHWQNDGCALWDDGTCQQYGICTRQTFYAFMANDPRGLNRVWAQCDVFAPVNGVQEWLRDVMAALRGGQRCDLIENYWQNQFDQPDVYLEIDGRLDTRLCLCTGESEDASQVLAGYGSGCSDADGAFT